MKTVVATLIAGAAFVLALAPTAHAQNLEVKTRDEVTLKHRFQ